MSITEAPTPRSSAEAVWHSLDATEIAARLSVDVKRGLDEPEVERRIGQYGLNAIPQEPPPSTWSIALAQLSNPMNIMLIIVALASLLIEQVPTALIVGGLVTFNVVMGTNQERKARASVDALAQLQVPHARVRRSGEVVQIESTQVVPGDVVLLEAGDVVPADGRIVNSATLEVQEAALTGESAPVGKDTKTIPDPETALGDRTDMVFQNTQVTRGTATVIVTGTGTSTQMGHIAGMVSSVKRTKSPLQQELDGLTKVFGFVAWGAVAIIAIAGLLRDQDVETLLLLCISTAIASIPTGLPTFVQTMLSSGARHLAEEKAVVKTLTDVETLGGTTAINSDKTGTLTMNAMTATMMLTGGEWYRIEGSGYSKQGAVLGAARGETPDFTRLAWGLALSSDATVADDGSIIGDPTEAAMVVLAAKIGADAVETRRAMPRVAEVPFDSEYKFMATFHDRPPGMKSQVLSEPHVMCVKGAPDVVMGLCDRVYWHGDLVPIDQVRADLEGANRELSEKGLRVLAFAVGGLDDSQMDQAMTSPFEAVENLVFVSLVGIIDPLRLEARDAVQVALGAGIDVRMITGDHTITARAIADQLGLGPGVITGVELGQMSDDKVVEDLPQIHVFGRVAPEDKVRLASLMQKAGDVVAMTGDAVNDAAALKQADIGVAMGSGSEVTQQAAKMILTDDNFATLVKAVELGRDIYRRISSYIRLQLSVLSSVLQLMLLATIFNINEGVAMFPMMLLFCKLFVVVTIVIGFIADVADPGVMEVPPRRPGTRIVNGHTVPRWLITGFLIAIPALLVLVNGPDEPSTTDASVTMTMAFAVVALGAVNVGLVLRREQRPWFSQPAFPYLGWIALGWLLTWAAVELDMLQRLLVTTSLEGSQWLIVIGLSLIAAVYCEIDRVYRRRKGIQLFG
ncbi:MAG TPA: cation-transporting P-type ATPase [Acidimicrobiia bacterium]|nr:cation-transporting P-type ATPase [Acidimicrobiia bacterium]